MHRAHHGQGSRIQPDSHPDWDLASAWPSAGVPQSGQAATVCGCALTSGQSCLPLADTNPTAHPGHVESICAHSACARTCQLRPRKLPGNCRHRPGPTDPGRRPRVEQPQILDHDLLYSPCPSPSLPDAWLHGSGVVANQTATTHSPFAGCACAFVEAGRGEAFAHTRAHRTEPPVARPCEQGQWTPKSNLFMRLTA